MPKAVPRAAVRRLTAGLAAIAVVAGSAVFARAVVADQGWLYSGFVSEAGEAGAAYAGAYRLGVLLLAAGLFLLGLAVSTVRLSPVWVVPAAVGMLVLAAAFAATSGLVTCSAGCPLPPYERPTAGDLVHAGASVAGVAAVVAAMGALALGDGPGPRRAARVWLAVAVAPLVVTAVGLLGLGRGYLTGTAEKVLLAVVIGWTLTMSVLLVSVPSGRSGSV